MTWPVVTSLKITREMTKKTTKLIYGFPGRKQKYMLFYFCLDDMVRSIDRHQAIFTN
jgi:hypothetical protein